MVSKCSCLRTLSKKFEKHVLSLLVTPGSSLACLGHAWDSRAHLALSVTCCFKWERGKIITMKEVTGDKSEDKTIERAANERFTICSCHPSVPGMGCFVLATSPWENEGQDKSREAYLSCPSSLALAARELARCLTKPAFLLCCYWQQALSPRSSHWPSPSK